MWRLISLPTALRAVRDGLFSCYGIYTYGALRVLKVLKRGAELYVRRSEFGRASSFRTVMVNGMPLDAPLF